MASPTTASPAPKRPAPMSSGASIIPALAHPSGPRRYTCTIPGASEAGCALVSATISPAIAAERVGASKSKSATSAQAPSVCSKKCAEALAPTTMRSPSRAIHAPNPIPGSPPSGASWPTSPQPSPVSAKMCTAPGPSGPPSTARYTCPSPAAIVLAAKPPPHCADSEAGSSARASSPRIIARGHRERRSAPLARRDEGGIAALFVQGATQSEAVQRGCSAARVPWEVCPRAASAKPARAPARLARRVGKSASRVGRDIGNLRGGSAV